MEQNSETILSFSKITAKSGRGVKENKKAVSEREDATIFHVNDSLRGRLVGDEERTGPTG